MISGWPLTSNHSVFQFYPQHKRLLKRILVKQVVLSTKSFYFNHIYWFLSFGKVLQTLKASLWKNDVSNLQSQEGPKSCPFWWNRGNNMLCLVSNQRRSRKRRGRERRVSQLTFSPTDPGSPATPGAPPSPCRGRGEMVWCRETDLCITFIICSLSWFHSADQVKCFDKKAFHEYNSTGTLNYTYHLTYPYLYHSNLQPSLIILVNSATLTIISVPPK